VYQQHPSFQFFDPGIYEVSLTVTGFNDETDTENITVLVLSEDAEQQDLGDVNGDGSVKVVDIIFCTNYILEFIDFSPEAFLAADVNGDSKIDIFDVLLIADLAY
jgi:PKD repeat protein